MSPSSAVGSTIAALVLPGLLKSGRVHLYGFGVFTLTTRKARRIRNPQTKELMWLPETVDVRFRASKRLKTRLKRETS